jgi:omega-3 fatty acid desaturase (delta-15 desaturase)
LKMVVDSYSGKDYQSFEKIMDEREIDLNKNPVVTNSTSSTPTYGELKKMVPKHCMEIDLSTSMYYFLRDYAAIAFLYLIVGQVEEKFGYGGLFVWYCLQGLFMGALFLIGHDAVHGLVAKQSWINFVVGHLSLSPILIPYCPWNKTHGEHHTHTYHIEKDRGHPWVVEEDYKGRSWFEQNFCRIPISAFFRFHMYTILGLPDGSHFNPWSKIITNNRERMGCIFSGATCALSAYIAFLVCGSWFTFFKYYYVPLAFQNFWLVLITYLNHQDDDVEVYEEGNYKYMPAQFETIDRYLGFGIDHILHNATDCHVAHHLFFTKIPHYHLVEATKAIQPIFEKYPGLYKRQSCYNFVYEFLRLNIQLEYLVGRGTGKLHYNHSKRV